ncbi:MAG: catalase [Bacilli bacterium]|nr:catalase [Bacilli bacterium]
MKYKITIRNTIRHFHLINKHRFLVWNLCRKVGLPIHGLFHDLSKYSPTEFWESVKYYQGTYSPIRNCKTENGYSKAWLHHKGRNKHHYEYWYDEAAPNKTPIMPKKYFKEMICDSIAAGIGYQGKNWNKEYQLTYWNKTKNRSSINETMKETLSTIYEDLANYGLKKVINKSYLDQKYEEMVEKDNAK